MYRASTLFLLSINLIIVGFQVIEFVVLSLVRINSNNKKYQFNNTEFYNYIYLNINYLYTF